MVFKLKKKNAKRKLENLLAGFKIKILRLGLCSLKSILIWLLTYAKQEVQLGHKQ